MATKEQFEQAAAEESRVSVDPKEVLAVVEALIEIIEAAYDSCGTPYGGPGSWCEQADVKMARKLVAKFKEAGK